MQIVGNNCPHPRALWPATGYLAAAISSLLITISHSNWGNGLWALAALVPLLFASARAPKLHYVIIYGFIASIGPSSLMFESIAISHTPAAILALLSQAPQFILPLVVWSVLQRKYDTFAANIAFCTLWLVLEQLRMHPIVSGYYASFYSLAYSQVNTGLLFPIQFGGIITTTLLILGTNSLATSHLLRRNILGLLPLMLVCSPLSLGTTTYAPVADADTIPILAVQTAWTTSEQFQMLGPANNKQHLEEISYWSQQGDIEHIFLPEAILSGRSQVDKMAELMSASDSSLLAGVTMRNDLRPANNLFLIESDVSTRLYDKWQLVPAYESPIFESGDHVATLQFGDALSVGFLICMDGTNEWLVKRSVEAGADVLVVISASDYGTGFSTPELHLQLIRAQAQVFGTPILFIASNGPTAFVTPDSVVRERIDEGVQGTLMVDLTIWEPLSSSRLPHVDKLFKLLPILLSVIPLFISRMRVAQ